MRKRKKVLIIMKKIKEIENKVEERYSTPTYAAFVLIKEEIMNHGEPRTEAYRNLMRRAEVNEDKELKRLLDEYVDLVSELRLLERF